MTLRDAMMLAVSSLRGSFTRTLLTVLGLGVGVGAVLTVLTLGSAGETRVEQEIARLGVDKVWITAADEKHVLTPDCAARVAEETGAAACAGAYTMGFASLGDHSAAVQIAGYDTGMAAVHAPEAAEGRLFTRQDHQERRSVCIVDEALAQSLGGNVLHRRITAGGRRFLVVGVMDGMPMQAMAVGSGLMVLPLTAYADTFGEDVRELTMSVSPGQDAGRIADAALLALSADGGFRADTLEEEIDAARQVVRIFVMVLACVAAVCMLTGAIGVMNVLLVSVRERRREIGLIKALGGTGLQVGVLFLLEAAVYALLGGALGTALGAGMISVFGRWIGLDAALDARTALPVLLAACVLGAVFGVAPAMKASAMQPVDALRSE
ncbi:MAG: ABC transporter permease [Clostridiales bacterium]|nr:ABC transporter permease [Clostridiales bacterium]